jgi:hypothetical protein
MHLISLAVGFLGQLGSICIVIRVHVNLFDEKMSRNEKVHWTSEGA